jgi:serine protease AprX
MSLRVPGSFVDDNYPGGLVNGALFRGSGTSQATAVVAGAAALILQQRPTITPDDLKKLLMDSATSLKGVAHSSQGNGELNLASAIKFTTKPWSVPATPSTGTGSLELARGSLHVENYGVVLEGEQDIFGKPFDAATMAILEATGSSWSGGLWNASSWSGSSWSASSWSGSSWSGSSWSASSWSGSSWSGSSWSSSSWSSSSWSSSSWSSSSWSSAGWLGASWD